MGGESNKHESIKLAGKKLTCPFMKFSGNDLECFDLLNDLLVFPQLREEDNIKKRHVDFKRNVLYSYSGIIKRLKKNMK